VGSVFLPVKFLLPVTETQNIRFQHDYRNTETNKMNCELMLAYYTPALRQTGSRNLTGKKTLPTIWGTYIKLVTKYQIKLVTKYQVSAMYFSIPVTLIFFVSVFLQSYVFCFSIPATLCFVFQYSCNLVFYVSVFRNTEPKKLRLQEYWNTKQKITGILKHKNLDFSMITGILKQTRWTRS
jgi:hypothetical protein